MFYAYAIKSLKRGYIYVGITSDVDKRTERHNKGREKVTRFYSPFRLIFLTSNKTRKNAREVEIYLKSGIGKEFLKSFI